MYIAVFDGNMLCDQAGKAIVRFDDADDGFGGD